MAFEELFLPSSSSTTHFCVLHSSVLCSPSFAQVPLVTTYDFLLNPVPHAALHGLHSPHAPTQSASASAAHACLLHGCSCVRFLFGHVPTPLASALTTYDLDLFPFGPHVALHAPQSPQTPVQFDEHWRSVVAVGACDCHSFCAQAVSGVHVRSDVAVDACDSYWLSVHVVSGVHAVIHVPVAL